MSDPRHTGPSSSSLVDDEGVRVLRKPGASRFGLETTLFAGIVLVVGLSVTASLWWPADASTPAVDAQATTPAAIAPEPPHETTTAPRFDRATQVAGRLAPTQATALHDRPAPTGDPDDLASYFRPGDPVPSTANLIKALNDAGVRTGIAAFNPPGTSPPLEGLAVPADFELPPGYVRHHQVSDDGVPIEPILMFSPDLVLRDAQGRPIALPANRVVPPGLAPPGLPLRWVRPGTP
ncbi:MAG: hypothetical protein ACRC2H_06655 [Silanimonas sp.]